MPHSPSIHQFAANGRTYQPPGRPVVAVCLDGSADEDLDATLAKQTHDEEGRQRCLLLEQTFLKLAETEEQLVPQMSGDTNQWDCKLSPLPALVVR